MPNPLPDAWVERIFQKLSVVYGRDFLNRYEGLDMADVMADWGVELAGYQANGPALKYALEILPPSKAPTVLEFRDLCRRAPQATTPRLKPPVATEKERADAVMMCRELRIRVGGKPGDPKEWAHRLAEKEEAGEPLSSAQKRFWREALIGAEA